MGAEPGSAWGGAGAAAEAPPSRAGCPPRPALARPAPCMALPPRALQGASFPARGPYKVFPSRRVRPAAQPSGPPAHGSQLLGDPAKEGAASGRRRERAALPWCCLPPGPAEGTRAWPAWEALEEAQCLPPPSEVRVPTPPQWFHVLTEFSLAPLSSARPCWSCFSSSQLTP